MPAFGETPELAESGSHSQNPGIGRIDPPPRGRGSDPGIGVFLGGGPRNPGNRGIRRNSGSSWKWLIQGGAPPKVARNRPKVTLFRGPYPQKRPKPGQKRPKPA